MLTKQIGCYLENHVVGMSQNMYVEHCYVPLALKPP